jgi:hypothetical protein
MSEVFELLIHPLFSEDKVPRDLDDLIEDRCHGSTIEERPICEPRYERGGRCQRRRIHR